MKYSDTYSSYLIRLAILQEDLGDKIQKVCKKQRKIHVKLHTFNSMKLREVESRKFKLLALLISLVNTQYK